jgi:hypothetical protein
MAFTRIEGEFWLWPEELPGQATVLAWLWPWYQSQKAVAFWPEARARETLNVGVESLRFPDHWASLAALVAHADVYVIQSWQYTQDCPYSPKLGAYGPLRPCSRYSPISFIHDLTTASAADVRQWQCCSGPVVRTSNASPLDLPPCPSSDSPLCFSTI